MDEEKYKNAVAERSGVLHRARVRISVLESALRGLLSLHRDGSAEEHWAEWDAAYRAYCRAAVSMHGEFARLS